MRVLCCLLLVWSALLSEAKPQATKESQDAAVAAIKKLGGRVEFDEKDPDKPLIGVNFFGTDLTDAGLVHLKSLTSLKSLDLWSTKVNGTGLVYLIGLTSLESLNLQGTQVTDSVLENLMK